MKKLILFLGIAIMILIVPINAEDNTVSFKDFLEDLTEDGIFDGKGSTIKWEPNEYDTKIQRIQNSNAQYQISLDDNSDDVIIKNATFEYVPADIPNHNDAWNTGSNSYSAEEIRNAEFQLLSTGNVTIENCKFEKVIVSPYGSNIRENDENREFIVKNSSFSNVYNAYALKDIYPHSAYIENNIFNNCSGGIYFEGAVSRGEIVIKNNSFSDMDKYAIEGKTDTRGLIQFSSQCKLNESTNIVIEGNEIRGNLVKASNKDENNLMVIRQLSDMADVNIDNWGLGNAFSVKIEGEGLRLPTMNSGEGSGGYYEFIGWASADIYNGPIDVTEAEKFLIGGESIAEKGKYYYAVWKYTKEEKPDNEDHATCAGDKDKNCDGVITCDEEIGEGWTWNNETKVCEYTKAGKYTVVNTSAK